MRRYYRSTGFCTLAFISALIFMCNLAFGARVVPSTDLIPSGDWTYDAMISLAGDGLVPGTASRVFQGDRLFNRIEMALEVASVAANADVQDLSPGQIALLDKLISEFKPELGEVSPDTSERWLSQSADANTKEFLPIGYLQLRATENSDDSLLLPYRITGYANLSNHTFAAATLAEHEEKFFHNLRTNKVLDRAFIRGFDSSFVWSVGREHLNWGPAYSGSLILSDNSPGFIQARGIKEVDFGKFLGRVKITQFAGTFEDDDKTLYLFGRRYEKKISNRLYAGISEAAKTSVAPNPLILVTPFYLYQHLFNHIDEEFNAIYGADLSYLAPSGMQVYGELAIDDFPSPEIIGADWKGPRKEGYTLGIYFPKVFKSNRYSSFRAEYIYINQRIYEATRTNLPELAYTHDGEIIGHPIGPNSNALYLRGEHYITDKLSVIGEYFNQRQTSPGDPERGSRRVLSMQAAYDFSPDRSIALRVSPFKITQPNGSTESGAEYQLRAYLAF